MLNFRSFLNMEEVLDALQRNSVTIMDVDELSSFQQQADMISQSKVIIMEMGSALIINGCILATDSHIIVLNDFMDLANSDYQYVQVYKKLVEDHNNSHESFLSFSNYVDTPFSIDVQRLESRIKELRKII